ncbi:MAG: DUF4105 domain-containing protein [Deltaproteobacteria bacterium]|nr:DUF4105 domain-containing protein [Deltaproteobacteria bacterium]
MKLALALAVVATAAGVAHAQPQELAPGALAMGPMLETEPPIVELFTFGVGERIFERFGHAALCLRYHDPQTFPAVCFNFGVTNFEEGAPMIWSFLRSTQRFWAEPTKYGTMYQFYASEDRDIWKQELPLDHDEARSVEAELWRTITEENRYYFYDHFAENCSTRLRDILDHVSGGKLRASSTTRYPLTYRELGKRGLAELPPMIALADFVLGRQLDEHPTGWEAMFHPDILRREVELRFGVTPQPIYKRRGPPIDTEGSTGRLTLLVIAVLFALPLAIVRALRRGARVERWAIAWTALYLGVWGVVIWTLAIVSSIPGLRWNELVFVLVPFDLALPWLAPSRRRSYARARVGIILVASALAALGVFHQPLWIPMLTAFMPLAIIAFGVRHGLAPSLHLESGGRGEIVAVRGARREDDAEQMKDQAGQDEHRVAEPDEHEPQHRRDDAAGIELTGARDDEAQDRGDGGIRAAPGDGGDLGPGRDER